MADKSMLSVEAAEKIIASFPVRVRRRTVSLLAARNRILAQDILAPFPMPEFNKSAMDGYAYISADRSAAYKIIETIAAGKPPCKKVLPGQCAKIMTGAMLPPGADRVVKRECTHEENGFMKVIADDNKLNIRVKGEDLKAGQMVLEKGTLLRPAQIALLASLGFVKVATAKPPRIGIITTGTELVEPGTPLQAGQIYNSNYYSLAAQIRALGAKPVSLGRVIDNAAVTVKAIVSGLQDCDVLILSGGVSAGDFDYVPTAMKNAGLTLHVEKISVQPGMPTIFGSRKEKAAFGLPGNPVSTFVIFDVFIKPLIMRLMGHEFQPLTCQAILRNEYCRSQAARSAFLPIRIDKGRAIVMDYHGSAHLHALGQANGLLYIPAGQNKISAGSMINVRCL
ncbi:MAG: molybdopterin molybdotransferase MoeA [Candidatus Aminicenantes bacterium]|nr:molybdopterin molybdotransferase MoeA [Candidatus Aminicenantes bacterium]